MAVTKKTTKKTTKAAPKKQEAEEQVVSKTETEDTLVTEAQESNVAETQVEAKIEEVTEEKADKVEPTKPATKADALKAIEDIRELSKKSAYYVERRSGGSHRISLEKDEFALLWQENEKALDAAATTAMSYLKG